MPPAKKKNPRGIRNVMAVIGSRADERVDMEKTSQQMNSQSHQTPSPVTSSAQ